VTSEAGQFPIIAGVLRLLADELTAPLVGLVSAGRQEEALRAALDVPFLSRRAVTVNALWRRAARALHLGPGSHAVGLSKQHMYRLVTQSNVSFARLVSGAGVKGWTNWQTHRFSMPTFLPVYPLAYLAKGSRRILDFGCGLAHSAFLMSRVAEQAEIVCADYSFTSLYLGKRFLVPHAECVCLDGDYPMPFADAYVDCVFSTDALQYIEPKVGLAREFQRVLSTTGVIVLAHLHNTLSPAKGPAGKALTPAGYHGLFDGMPRRLYPEESIVADYVAEGALHLEREWSLGDLDHRFHGVSLVAGYDDSIFTLRSGILDAYIDAMRHPHTNPAYEAAPADGAWVLERNIGAPYAVECSINDCELLPRSWQLDLNSVSSSEILALRAADRTKLRELVRRLLVLDMPETYV